MDHDRSTRRDEQPPRGGPGPTVVVVGGGVAGLTAAIVARRGGADVTLLEAHPLGGRARTDKRGGFTFNRGPRALYRGGRAHQLLPALGVDVTTGGAPILRGALALTGAGTHRLPVGTLATLATSLFGPGEKLGAARHLLPLLRDPGPIAPDVTLGRWLDERRTGGRLRAFLEAMVRVATYCDAPELLSAADALGQARMAATSGVRYLDGGFGAIVGSLATTAEREGVAVERASVRGVGRADGRWQVGTSAGPREADAVILATGGPRAAAALLDVAPPAWAHLGPAARAACLELGVRRIPAHRFVLGIDRPTYLSVHAPPASLAPSGQAVVHVARYRRSDDDLDPAASRAELLQVAAAAGIAPTDIVEERYLDAMEVTGAIPTAATGGVRGRPSAAVEQHPGLFVAGDWVGPEGMLLDAAVASAVAAGEQAAARRATMAAT